MGYTRIQIETKGGYFGHLLQFQQKKNVSTSTGLAVPIFLYNIV
jgi:hypothetical protein